MNLKNDLRRLLLLAFIFLIEQVTAGRVAGPEM
jgi:hypothetical protein